MPQNGRDKIVHAAFKLFLHSGYQRTSLADIIKATALSKGAIYHHFKSKYEIYLATLDEFFFKLYDNFIIEDESLNLFDRIKNRFSFFVDLIDFIETDDENNTYPIRRYFLFQLESEEDDTIREHVQLTLQQLKNEISDIVKQAIENKEITVELPVSVIVQQILALIEGIAIHHSTVKNNAKEFLLQKYNDVVIPYLNLITT
ncbi:TetR/AcrR family transcriptional regulator [Tenacibaculum holothuriorum]|uniref:TetR/AcrR family transcriptional regulator n=1 Tax=Tenacibaculum holothuriorum TaxID=1635173 RepID=UPI000A327E90|nr:TetR/AcrR family transcriptional regulator [Tenacibaculum holothuriorum]